MVTRRRKPRRKNKTVKRERCSRSSPDHYSCYDTKSLIKLRQYWNIRHPDQEITSEKPREIWKALKNNLSHICDKESCWLRQQFIKHKLDNKLLNLTFAPQAPQTWQKNPNEWLNSLDITRVMRQFEDKYPNFQFIGPSPIDFDDHKVDGDCVWEELCQFDLAKTLKQNKTKIGVIFNLDPHYKGGSHWNALFISIPHDKCLFCDSTGDPAPKEVKRWADRVSKQAASLGKSLQLEVNTIKHQKKDTECGIYSIYFLDQMLRQNPPQLFTERIPDDMMQEFRDVYFNLSG